jgi:hypothetical protein
MKAERLGRAGIGIALGAAGFWVMFNGGALGLILFGPLLVAVGGVAFLRGLFPAWQRSGGCGVLLAGLILLGLAVIPMLLLFLGIIEDNESTGMLATILLLFVGVPALIVMLIGLGLWAWERA